MTATSPRARARGLAAVAAVAALVLVAAACGGDDDDTTSSGKSSGDSGSKAMTIKIQKPAEAYADGFKLKFDTSVAVDKPDTGEHHIHLFRDGNTSKYDLIYDKSFTVKDLKPGQHTLKAVIANADHSLTDASDEVKVNVEAGSSDEGDSGDNTTTTADSGY